MKVSRKTFGVLALLAVLGAGTWLSWHLQQGPASRNNEVCWGANGSRGAESVGQSNLGARPGEQRPKTEACRSNTPNDSELPTTREGRPDDFRPSVKAAQVDRPNGGNTNSGYAQPWDKAAAEQLEFRQAGNWQAERANRDKGVGSVLVVKVDRAPNTTQWVTAWVLTADAKSGVTASCNSEHEGTWAAQIGLPLSLSFPIFVKIRTNDSEFQGLVTRAHLRDGLRIGKENPLSVIVSVDAGSVPARNRLSRLRCVLPDGSPLTGVAAQFRPFADMGYGSIFDATLLGMSDDEGAIALASLWCAGAIEDRGLMLHAPGFVPIIVEPKQLAVAAGGELKVVFKHRELTVKAECRLTPEQIARAKPLDIGAAQDVLPLAETTEPDLGLIGKMYRIVFSNALDVEHALTAGWNFAPLEELLERKIVANSYDELNDFNPLETLSWYRNQRQYDVETGYWTFTLPSHGVYAVPLAVGHDAKGELELPLALVIDARKGRTPVITLLAKP